MNRKLETLQVIMDRAESFLKEQPRKNWVKIRNISGVEAILFYNSPATAKNGIEGICLQFLHKDYSYCFTKHEVPRWEELTNSTKQINPWIPTLPEIGI